MNTFTEYVNITSDKLVITFPPDFYKGKALLEIKPILEEISDKNSDDFRRENFRNLLLKRPFSLSNQELKNFKKISKWMDEWNPTQF